MPEPDMRRGREPCPSLVLLVRSEVETYGTVMVVPSPVAPMENTPVAVFGV